MKFLRSVLAFGIYPLIIVFVSQQRIHVMVEGDSIDGLEKITDDTENDDMSKPDIPEFQVETSQSDGYNQQELRGQLESCLTDYSILNEKLYEKEGNNDKLAAKKWFPKKINDGFFKQFVRHFLEKMSCLDEECPEPSDIVYIYLTPGNVDTLYNYVAGKGDTADALYVMKNMIQGVELTEYTSYWDRLISAVGVDATLLKVIIGVTAILICCAAFEMKTTLSWLNQLLIVFVIIFVISIPWNWLQLYQEKLAERHADMMKEKDIPEYCRPGAKLTPWKAVTQFFQKFTSIKDECKEYHKRYMIDPILEVSPIKAVAKTVAVLLFAPAGELGKAVAEFHNEFLGNMPKLIWIPAFASWLLILAVVLLSLYYGCSGYVNIHQVAAASPQVIAQQPSRQMIEDIIQEQMRRESYIGYTHQEYPSPSLPPVTLRARGHSSMQELEAQNQRPFRRSQDYVDGRGSSSSTPENSSTSPEKNKNVERTEYSEIVKEALAQVLQVQQPGNAEKKEDPIFASPSKDNTSGGINKYYPVQESRTLHKECLQSEEMSEQCESTLAMSCDVENEGVGTQVDGEHLQDGSSQDVANISSTTLNDLPSNDDDDDDDDDDNNEYDDFVVLQSSN